MTRWPARLVLAALLAACGGTPEPVCTSTVECGDGQACLDGACLDVECLAATQCPLGSSCSPVSYTCEPGCATSDDCLLGDRCDVATPDEAGLGVCTPRTCRDTQLDCDLGERCDTTTGACYEDPLPYCDACNDDFDCGAGGVCAYLSRVGPPRCLLPCSPEAFDPCPAGLQCSAQVNADGTPAGFLCIGLCGRL